MIQVVACILTFQINFQIRCTMQPVNCFIA